VARDANRRHKGFSANVAPHCRSAHRAKLCRRFQLNQAPIWTVPRCIDQFLKLWWECYRQRFQRLMSVQAALSSMIANARIDLYSELEKFEEARNQAGESISRTIKPRLDKLLPRLRMCDAMWKSATDEELMRVLYPEDFRNGKVQTAEERARRIRTIREDQRAAIQMMESGYLELVPLDYLEWEPLQLR